MIAAAGASKHQIAGDEEGVSTSGGAPNPTAEADVDEQLLKMEGAPKAAAADADAATAVASASSPRSDASDAPSSVGVSSFTGCDESGVYV